MFSVTGITITLTCVNQLLAWVDGEFQDVPNWKNKYESGAGNVTVPNGRHLLAINCYKFDRLGGILWSTNTSQVSDTDTMCSSVYKTGWNKNKFEMDENWAKAESYGKNGNLIMSHIDGISDDAEWIWTGPQFEDKSSCYCRRMIRG